MLDSRGAREALITLRHQNDRLPELKGVSRPPNIMTSNLSQSYPHITLIRLPATVTQ